MTKKNLQEELNIDALVESVIEEAVQDSLVMEGLQPKMHVRINGKEVSFGSREHIMDLRRVLMGLEALKNCYAKGTANRHVYANSCTKLRRLIKRLILDLQKTAQSQAPKGGV